MIDLLETRKNCDTRLSQLKNERASWDSKWREYASYISPESGRFTTTEKNKGGRSHKNIYDSTATRGLKILIAGMMSGATSPSRPWFKLRTPDHDLNSYHPVKLWLNVVENRMNSIFHASNLYRTFPIKYHDLAVFGTSATLLLSDYERVIHLYPSTAGEYYLSSDNRGKINTYYRELQLTVASMVREFGYENCSNSVKNMFDKGNLDNWINIVHAIEPRDERNRNISLRDAKNMTYASYYYETGSNENKFLRESGYNIFPVLAPRWDVLAGNVYGTCPTAEAIGDIKQLQHQQLRKAQAIDYQTNPPLQVPITMKNRETDFLPNGITYVDTNQNNASVRTAFDVNLRLDYLLQDIQDVRQRINSSFFADMFLMLANATDTRMTATEVAERHEEKLLMLGPVVDRIHNEMLSPAIDLTFYHMLEAGLIPEAPEEIQGQELSAEFVSMIAQAQKAIGSNSIDRFVNNLGMVAQIKPDVLDKFNADAWVDAYSDILGVDPRMIISGDNVAMIRQQRAQMESAQAQVEAMKTQSEIAKNLSESQAGEDTNALSDLMQI